MWVLLVARPTRSVDRWMNTTIRRGGRGSYSKIFNLAKATCRPHKRTPRLTTYEPVITSTLCFRRFDEFYGNHHSIETHDARTTFPTGSIGYMFIKIEIPTTVPAELFRNTTRLTLNYCAQSPNNQVNNMVTRFNTNIFSIHLMSYSSSSS